MRMSDLLFCVFRPARHSFYWVFGAIPSKRRYRALRFIPYPR